MGFFVVIDWCAVIILVLFGLALLCSAVETIITWGIAIVLLHLVKYLVLDIFISPLLYKHRFIKCLLCFGMDIFRLGVFVFFTYLYYQETYIECTGGFFSELICSIFTLVYVGCTGGLFILCDMGISGFHERARSSGEDIVKWNFNILVRQTLAIVISYGGAMFFNWLML